MTELILQSFLPPFLGMLATILVGVIARAVTKWTGVEIEARHREALQSALENGANFAIARYEPGSTASAVAMAAAYVQKSVPDAVRNFDLGPEDLTRLVIPRISERIRSRP